MIVWDYVTASSCCHSLSVSLIWHRPPLVRSQDKCPSHKKTPSARFRHAAPSGSAATASDLSNWLLSTTHYSCIMRTKKEHWLKFLKFGFILIQHYLLILCLPVVLSPSAIFSKMLQECFIYWLFLCQVHRNQWNIPPRTILFWHLRIWGRQKQTRNYLTQIRGGKKIWQWQKYPQSGETLF